MAWVVESIRESLVCLTSLATRSRVSITLFLVLEMTEWLLLFDTMIGGPCSVWFIDPTPQRESTGFKLWNTPRSYILSPIFSQPSVDFYWTPSTISNYFSVAEGSRSEIYLCRGTPETAGEFWSWWEWWEWRREDWPDLYWGWPSASPGDGGGNSPGSRGVLWGSCRGGKGTFAASCNVCAGTGSGSPLTHSWSQVSSC